MFGRKGSRVSVWLLLLVAILTTHTTIVCQAKTQYSSRSNSNSNSNNNRRNASTSTDPYEILGVSRKSSLDDIKHHYRNLAKTHHPDKGGNPDTFAKIANAYEILSDPAQRRRHDQLNYRGTAGQQPKPQFYQQQQQKRQKEEIKLRKARDLEENLRKKRKRNDTVREARQMQNHLLRLHTVEQMIQEGIINQDRIFVKNFVGVFVGNKQEEKQIDNDFLFPYPFSGRGRNGILWSTVLQAAKIRYNKPTEFTALFKVHYRSRNLPHIIFGRAGESIQNVHMFKPSRLDSDPQEQLERWVMGHLSSRITIINRHHSPVKLFLVSDQTKQDEVLIHILNPGHAMPFVLQTADKIVAIDARVDEYPGSPNFDPASFRAHEKSFHSLNPDSWYFQNPAVLGEYLVGLETTLEIEEEHCFDLSLKCQHWMTFGNNQKQQSALLCQEQAEFMHHICPASCGICQRKQNSWLHGLSYRIRDAPLYYWPQWIRPIIQFLRFVWQDLRHMFAMRRTIALVFCTAGVVLGVNAFVLPAWMLGDFGHASAAVHFSWHDLRIFALSFATITFWVWLLLFTSPSNSALRRDWDHVLGHQMDAIVGLVGWGVSLAVIFTIILSSFWRQRTLTPWTTKLAYSFFVLLLFACLTTVLVFVSINMDHVGYRHQRWRHIWRLRKNVAVALVFTGIVLGTLFGPFWNFVRRFHALAFLIVLDVAVIVAFDVLSMNDPYFMKDLDHVLRLRMSAAIPIFIAGLLVGCGVPFGIMDLWPLRKGAGHRRPPPASTKLKAD
jgi:curved DNA-binding protein CbpA